jgi:hypothetical protein
MNEVLRYTLLAFQLNHLVDEDNRLDIEETYNHIQDGTLFAWLKHQFGDIDISLYKDDDREAVVDYFERLMVSVDTSRKFGIEQNGLCLLVTYCLQGIQDLCYS